MKPKYSSKHDEINNETFYFKDGVEIDPESENENMNDNLALQIIDEEVQEGFVINSDSLAEWALKKISEERAETQRYINVCDTMINDYNLKKQKAEAQLIVKTGYLIQKLQEYFNSVPHKSTKTQETYKLPSGTLKLKYQKPAYVRDDEKLIAWLKSNSMTDFIKIKESPDWEALKKEECFATGSEHATFEGEIIDGVTVQERPDTFEVEI